MRNRNQQILLDTLQRLIRRGATSNIQKVLAKTHPADLADLFRMLVPRDQRYVFDLMPNDAFRGEVLSELDSDVYVPLVQSMAVEDVVKVLKEMSTDDVADILGNLPEELSDAVLERMESRDSAEVETLLRYGEDTAGGIMVPDFFALTEDTSAEEAIQALREAKDVEMAFYVYVVNDSGHLVGVVSLRQLVTVPPATRLRNIMKDEVVSVHPQTDQEEVARLVQRYGFLAIPVIDDSNKLLGIVTVDDVIDVMREEANEDMLKMAGASQEMVETRSVWKNVRARMPWLVASCIGGLVAAAVMSPFQARLQLVPALALFIPIVLGMGGNVGTQSATIIVRGLATGMIDLKQFRSVVTREMTGGILIGLTYGVVVGAVAGFFGAGGASAPLDFGLVVGLAMASSMTIAATIGSTLPLIFARLHIDPAVATGPFVTTSVDVLGTLTYFSLATTLIAQLAG